MREGRWAFRIAFHLSSAGGPGLIWAAGRSKILRDLVQKERRNKVLRVIVHQVRTAGRCRSNQIICFLHIQSHMPRNMRAVHAI